MPGLVDWTPNLERLTVLMRGRLQSSSRSGATGYTAITAFSDNTVPSRSDAETALAMVCEEMNSSLGPVREAYWPALGACASYGAAALLELGDFPIQTRTDLSPREFFEDKHEKCLAHLTNLIAADPDPDDGDGDGVDSMHHRPLGCFPCGQLVGASAW